MESQFQFDPRPLRPVSGGAPHGSSLDQQRRELDRMLERSDRLFDSISQINAHQYVDQTVQIGGQ